MSKFVKIIEAAEVHAQLDLDRLLVQSVSAGLWVGMCGHAATVFASLWYHSPVALAVTKLVHGAVFPIAIWGIYLTGAELYTGNTMSMCIKLLHSRNWSAFSSLCRVFVVNTLGNLAGCLLAASMLALTTGSFSPAHPQANNLVGVFCTGKLSYNSFWPPFCSAVAANFFVCTAVYSAITIDDTLAKLVALWFFVAVFCFATLEHIVANFYLTSLCMLVEPYNQFYSLQHVLFTNWIPVWCGNTTAGCLLTGAVWWYCLGPRKSALLIGKTDPTYV